MADHLTEEEQIETLKRWWNENGRSVVFGVVLALAGYFGYQGWQKHERTQAETASNLYQQFTRGIESAGQGGESGDATRIAAELKQQFGDRIYASQAALTLAGQAAQANDLETAVRELQWVVDNGSEEVLKLVAKRRLASALAGRGELDQALALVQGDVPESFTALYAETRGDILARQGKVREARAAYQLALDKLLPAQANSAQLIELKIKGLGEGATDGAATDEESTESAKESE
ncbi:YfgM family protein [Biformimicrobium ophioploci]|uniref:Ancillary SecYEG translocon subunit n=1 Tax=Biformimicrobium ophioploci TaxID=3036711 RepID=A0ABQ6LZ66_9GAMM|nr:tetratricopeptide repeat protein [Microbulbifer sp. NKW57]GMG87399.1 YfgM family protein [Microbulbifer sp. NKW57]